jgi:GNAT superfamily N-acetyltransferase
LHLAQDPREVTLGDNCPVGEGARQLRRTDTELLRVDELLMLAYEAPSRRSELGLYLAAQPDGWFVIEEDGEIVAVAGAIAYGGFCWVGLVATHPAAQGRGLATRLSQHLLDWATSHGCSTVALDASDAGRPVYERLGFRALGPTVELVRDAGRPPHARAGAKLFEAGDLDEILELDRASFGGDRGSLLRALTNEYPDSSFVTRDARGRLTGYLVARGRLIGPGCACDMASAKRLAHSTRDDTHEQRLLVPLESGFLDALLELGFVERRRLTHMRLGDLEIPGARRQLIAQLSLAAG